MIIIHNINSAKEEQLKLDTSKKEIDANSVSNDKVAAIKMLDYAVDESCKNVYEQIQKEIMTAKRIKNQQIDNTYIFDLIKSIRIRKKVRDSQIVKLHQENDGNITIVYGR